MKKLILLTIIGCLSSIANISFAQMDLDKTDYYLYKSTNNFNLPYQVYCCETCPDYTYNNSTLENNISRRIGSSYEPDPAIASNGKIVATTFSTGCFGVAKQSLSIDVSDQVDLYATWDFGKGWFAESTFNGSICAKPSCNSSVNAGGGNNTGNINLNFYVINFNWTSSSEVVCEGEPLSLTQFVNTNGHDLDYTITGQNVSNINNDYIFNSSTPGTFTVTLSYDFDNGTSTKTMNIVVPQNPLTQDNVSFCENEGNYDLEGHYPYNGTYSSPYIQNNEFNPNLSGTGTNTVTYTWTSSVSGCELSADFTVTVWSAPTPSVPNDFTICDDEPSIDLTTLTTPTGGTFTGTGVSGTNYSAAVAGTGIHQVCYETPPTSLGGCITTECWNITVNPSVDVTAPNDFALCFDEGVQDFSVLVSPANGIFSGNGVTNTGDFTPTTAGQGTHNITYSFTNSSGCSDSETFAVTVNASPAIGGPNSLTFCEDEGVQDLAALYSPLNGTFTGAGIAGTNFNPDFAGVGNHNITYEYTTSSGCSDSKVISITVNPAAVVTVPTDFALCEDEGVQDFSVLVSPANGIFSGNGVTNAGDFTPTTSGTGSHTITYSFTNNDGCSDSETFIVTVEAAVNINAPNSLIFCEDAGTQDLSNSTSPNGGTFTGAGIAGTNFNPDFAGVGNHDITYEYTNGSGCSDSKVISITVNPAAVVTVPTDFALCEDAGTQDFTLLVSPNQGGTFTGNGVTASGIFTPTTAQVGVHSITYTFTNGSGCSDSETFIVTVNEAVEVTVTNVIIACTGDNPIDLNNYVTPTGGTFNGTGVSGNNYIPSFAGEGTHEITYTFTNGSGCSDTEVFDVVVNETPVLTVPDDFTLCFDADPVNLANLVSPYSEQFTGSGVTNAQFVADLAGEGSHPITYTYTSPEGCSATDYWNIDVVAAIGDTLSIGDDIAICLTNEPINLDSTNNITGGDYDGNGVINNIFYPTEAGQGNHTIVYSTIYNQCTLIDEREITVLNIPNAPQIDGSLVYCNGDFSDLEITNTENNIDYTWYIGGNNINTGVTMDDVLITEDATIVVLSSNIIGCESDPSEVDVTIETPSGEIVVSTQEINSGGLVNLSVDNAIDVAEYNWNLGDGNNSTNPSPNYYYFADENDQYYTVTCEIISNNGCSEVIELNGSIHVIAPIDPGTSISNIESLKELTIYPNPSSSIINIEFDYKGSENLIIKVSDIIGNTLKSTTTEGNSKIDISSLAQGMYFISIIEEGTNNITTYKIIKK